MKKEDITVETYNLKPHAIIGEKIEIITRHPESPILKIDEECNVNFYVMTTKDNTSAIIKKETDEECIKFAGIRKTLNSKIAGDRIIIKTKERKDISINAWEIINASSTHKAMKTITNCLTYCELSQEFNFIREAKSYGTLVSHKIFLINELEKKE